ncbi:hypothetical protein GCM10010872_27200 [Dyella flava]|nr:hypothetical protein GCM10010872_27200 [Dyella flava]
MRPQPARTDHKIVVMTQIAVAPDTDVTRASGQHDDGCLRIRRRIVQHALMAAVVQRQIQDMFGESGCSEKEWAKEAGDK